MMTIKVKKNKLIPDWRGNEFITLEDIEKGETGYEYLEKEFKFYMHPSLRLYFDFEMEGEKPRKHPEVKVVAE